MSIKTVEAYRGNELVAKHTILIGATGLPAKKTDFIALAGQSMADHGILMSDVERWVVRDPIAGE